MLTVEDTRMATTSEFSDFDYQPMSPLGPIALLLGLIALSAMLGYIGVIIAAVCSLVCVFCWFSIRRSESLGGGMAGLGTLLAVGSTITGAVMFYMAYKYECPPDYRRTNFPREIAEKQFEVGVHGERVIPPSVKALEGKKIFLKGFVWQTQGTRNRRDFILLKDSGECCFGGNPKSYDMIEITLDEDHESVEFPTLSMVSVAGILSADPTAPTDGVVYTMKAHKCERARTSF